MADILGSGLVDAANQVVRRELFEDSHRSDLIQALLEPYPEIATSRQAVASETRSDSEPLEEADDEKER